jgi:hypothetical protein
MKTERFAFHDAERAKLRATVATIEHELLTRPAMAPNAITGGADRKLLASWHALVDQLALGPEPDVRQCPVCHHTGLSEATRCGFCWSRLKPIGAKARFVG